MSRELREEGPRLEVIFSDDELTRLEEGLDASGYEGRADPTGREIRYLHPGGSTVRIFPLVGLLYVYPPGGTKAQRGPIEPFTPLKRECNSANEAWAASNAADAEPGPGPDASSSSSSDAAGDAGSGDPSTDRRIFDHRKQRFTDGDDDQGT